MTYKQTWDYLVNFLKSKATGLQVDQNCILHFTAAPPSQNTAIRVNLMVGKSDLIDETSQQGAKRAVIEVYCAVGGKTSYYESACSAVDLALEVRSLLFSDECSVTCSGDSIEQFEFTNSDKTVIVFTTSTTFQ